MKTVITRYANGMIIVGVHKTPPFEKPNFRRYKKSQPLPPLLLERQFKHRDAAEHYREWLLAEGMKAI